MIILHSPFGSFKLLTDMRNEKGLEKSLYLDSLYRGYG